MKLSCHLQKRMSERNISYEVLDLVMALGSFSKNGERIILDDKTLKTAIECTEKLKKNLLHLKKKKGASIVCCDDSLITSFFHQGHRNVKNK